jgi:hypothetical protein
MFSLVKHLVLTSIALAFAPSLISACITIDGTADDGGVNLTMTDNGVTVCQGTGPRAQGTIPGCSAGYALVYDDIEFDGFPDSGVLNYTTPAGL